MVFFGQDRVIDRHIRRFGRCVFIAATTTSMLAMPGQGQSIYDPNNPALPYLQPPAEAFEVLPPSASGNQVDWMAALRNGAITPWARLADAASNEKRGEASELDLDVVMTETGDLPPVVFSHASHTALLTCDACHPALVRPIRASNQHAMVAMVEGESCGLCHGTVAFPLADCAACHRETESR